MKKFQFSSDFRRNTVGNLFGGFLARILAVLAFSIGLCGAANATECAASYGLPNTISYPGTILVAGNLQIGDTIPGTVRPFSIAGTCPLGEGAPNRILVGSNIVACTLNGGSTEIMPGIYTTGIPGVGMRLRNSIGTPIYNGTSQLCNSAISTILAGGAYDFSGTLELVRIAGVIPDGSILAPAQFGWAFGVYNTFKPLNTSDLYNNSTLRPAGNITLKNISCTYEYPAVVTLRQAATGNFPAVGSTAVETPFVIGLKCDNAATIGVTFAGNSVPEVSLATGILGVRTGAGQATGFGIQIIEGVGRGPVVFRSRMAGGTIVANTLKDYPYIARYYRTGTMGPGVVHSDMVFTFDYQ